MIGSNTITMQQIGDIARTIGEKFRPDKVILFGSYSHGTPTADSDVDLLVVLSAVSISRDTSAEIRLQLDPSVPMDILVRSPAQIQQRLRMGDRFIQSILDEGTVMYEADHARVD